MNKYETGEDEVEKKKSAAKKMGVTGEGFRLLWEGKSQPSRARLGRIIEAYPMVNPDWLLTGRGPRERPPAPDIAQRTLQDIEARIARAREEQAALNAAPVDVAEDLTTAEGVEDQEPPAPAKRPKPGRRSSRDSA